MYSMSTLMATILQGGEERGEGGGEQGTVEKGHVYVQEGAGPGRYRREQAGAAGYKSKVGRQRNRCKWVAPHTSAAYIERRKDRWVLGRGNDIHRLLESREGTGMSQQCWR
jgi:hypothetical protein